MTQQSSDKPADKAGRASLLLLVVVLLVVLGGLFAPSLKSGWTLFLNDGPLGSLMADYTKAPGSFFGIWQDLNWVGANGGSLLPSFTFGEFWLFGPVAFSKFHAPIALFVLGIGAWIACRLMGFSPLTAVLTGFAAALNMNVFSNACWGLSSRPYMLGLAMLAVAALSTRGKLIWVRCALAGLAIGMGITEGADVGVIFSVVVGCYGIFYSLSNDELGSAGRLRAVARVVVVPAFALLMAIHIIIALVFNAKVLDAVASQKQMMSPEQRWDWATQWSLPKSETLRVLIPGLHGYRMDTPDGGRYWGAAGRDPHWEVTGQGYPRFSGAGEYVGVTVMMLALFACAQALRKKDSLYTPGERRLIGFWATVAVISLLFAWGRFAPFYRGVFALPYFSSFRNPIKWTHPLHLALLMLFAYGVQALLRGYLVKTATKTGFGTWWSKANAFDKRWVWGCAVFLALSVLGWMIYLTSTGDLTQHMVKTAVSVANEDPQTIGREVARFSQRELGLYLVFLTLSLAVMTRALSGGFSGSRQIWAGVLLGGLIVVDLSRANRPWIRHYDYQAKYESNPVIDLLRQQPGHQRVTVAPFSMRELSTLQQVYHGEWMQQQFPFYNIPSIDLIQNPRDQTDNIQFKAAFTGTNIVRLWELTSTRYVLGLGGPFSEMLGSQLDGSRGRFKPALPFTVFSAGEDRVGVTVTNQGPYSVIDFTGALPRASLFTQWEVVTNPESVQQRLADSAFDPHASVVLSQSPASPPTPGATAGKVEIESYSPKKVILRAEATAPSIVMLTDKFDTDWKVTIDGNAATLLRCNYLMHGVQIPAGQHQVEFQFQPQNKGLPVSIAAILIGVVLSGVLLATVRKGGEI